MTAILELREKRAKAWDAAKNFLDSKRSNDGTLSAEDAATYDRMEADVINLGKEIERQAAIDNEMAKATSKPIIEKPGTPSDKVKSGTAPMNTRWPSGRTSAPSPFRMRFSMRCRWAWILRAVIWHRTNTSIPLSKLCRIRISSASWPM